MQPSPEIRALVMRGRQLMAAKDLPGVMDLATCEPGFLLMGSAPNEWFTSPAAAEPMVRASVEGGSGRVPDNIEIEAYQEGTVGWAGLRWKSQLPNGASITLRWTEIFHQEGGTWKLVHGHVSVAVPDELVMNIAQ
jgi:ketosteroid isomerase-like protein